MKQFWNDKLMTLEVYFWLVKPKPWLKDDRNIYQWQYSRGSTESIHSNGQNVWLASNVDKDTGDFIGLCFEMRFLLPNQSNNR